MNFGDILEKILQKKTEQYNLNYGRQFDSFFTTLNSIPDISKMKIEPVLLVTDQRPFSLISIAYAIRLATSLGEDTRLYAITEGKHADTIKHECDEYNIALGAIESRESISVEDIHEIVDKYSIGIIILPYGHHLQNLILDKISATVLISSLKNVK